MPSRYELGNQLKTPSGHPHGCLTLCLSRRDVRGVIRAKAKC